MDVWEETRTFDVDAGGHFDRGFWRRLCCFKVPADRALFFNAQVEACLWYASRAKRPKRVVRFAICYPFEPASVIHDAPELFVRATMQAALDRLRKGGPDEEDLRLTVDLLDDERVFLSALSPRGLERKRRIHRRDRDMEFGGTTLAMQVFHWLADPHSGPPPQLGPSGLADLFE